MFGYRAKHLDQRLPTRAPQAHGLFEGDGRHHFVVGVFNLNEGAQVKLTELHLPGHDLAKTLDRGPPCGGHVGELLALRIFGKTVAIAHMQIKTRHTPRTQVSR